MSEFLWLSKWTWISIGVNLLCLAINVLSYRINAALAPAMGMGFHIGLIFAVAMIDRVFLAPER